MKQKKGLAFSNNAIVQVYLRYEEEADLNLFNFEIIRERYSSDDFRYVTGLIKLSNLQKIKHDLSDRNIFLAEI